MKKIFLLLTLVFLLLFGHAKAQGPLSGLPVLIDRAMSVWARNIVNANETFIFQEVAGIRAGDSIFTGDLNIIASFPGLLGTKVTNTFGGAAVVAGAVNQLTNDLGYWGLTGMTNSGSTILGGAFVNTYHVYNQGYANTLFTVDGNKGFVWYTDPTDSHDFTALSNPVMTLTSGGELQVDDIVADSMFTRVLDYEPPHGTFAFADSAYILDLTSSTWAKITNLNNDLYTVIDDDGVTLAGDTMSIVTPGDYMLWVSISFDGNQQDVYHCAIYKNSVITPFEMHRKTATNDTGNMSMSALLDELVVGDDISIYIQNTANNNDPTFISSQFMIYMIHPR